MRKIIYYGISTDAPFLRVQKGLATPLQWHVPQQLHGLNLFRCSLFLPTFCCVESGLLLEANFR